jgi:hypothetical protein
MKITYLFRNTKEFERDKRIILEEMGYRKGF